jgi:hypothetical protein
VRQRLLSTPNRKDTSVTQSTFEQPVPDLDRLRRVLAAIDADPLRWDQTNWCDCIAGYTVQDEGLEIEDEWLVEGTELPMVWIGHYERVSVSEVAQQLLGLTDLERDLLFAGSNSRQALQQVAELIAGRVGEPL